MSFLSENEMSLHFNYRIHLKSSLGFLSHNSSSLNIPTFPFPQDGVETECKDFNSSFSCPKSPQVASLEITSYSFKHMVHSYTFMYSEPSATTFGVAL